MTPFIKFFALVAFSAFAAWHSPEAHAKGYAPVMGLSPQGVTVATRANAEAVAVLTKVGNNVNATSSIIANITKGVTVEAVVTGAVSGASRGGAMGAAIGAVGAVALGALPWFVDAMTRSGVKINPDGTYNIPDAAGCQAGVACTEYSLSESFSGWFTFAGRQAMCDTYTPTVQALYPGYVISASVAGSACDYRTQGGAKVAGRTIVQRTTTYAVAPGRNVPLSEALPVLSATAPTVDEVQRLVDLGFPPEVAPVSITGPATAGETNTVKLGLDGSQETETCKFYLQYFPSNISAHPECTTTTVTPSKTDTKQVTTTNPDGSTSTQTISTTTPATTTTATVTKDKVEDPSPQDTPLADLPKLYTPKYATGLEGVWATQKAALTATPLASLATHLMPTVAASGSCPTMMINLNIASWANFGSKDVAPACQVWDWGRLIILVSALLLARALVFGG